MIRTVIWRNLQRLIRSRTTAAIIFVAPFVLIILLGLAFGNSKLSGIDVGIVDNGHDHLSDIISNLERHEFNVREYATEEPCIDSVKELENHVCIMLYSSDDKPTVRYYVDYSNMKLVFLLLNLLMDDTETQADALERDIIGQMIQGMQETATAMEDGQGDLVEIKKNLDLLDSELASLEKSVQSTALDANMDSDIEELESNRDSTLQNLSAIKSMVQEQREDLIMYRDLMSESRKDTDDYMQTLQDTYDFYECSQYDNMDLSPYIDDSDLFNAYISQQENPLCSALLTTQNIMDDDAQKYYDIEVSLNASIARLDRTEKSLEDIEVSTKESYDIAIERMKEGNEDAASLQNQKDAISKDVQDTQEIIAQGNAQIEQMENEMSAIHARLANITALSPDSVVDPIAIEVKPVVAKGTTLLYLFPTLLMILITYINILLSATIQIKDKVSSTRIRNLTIPINPYFFIIGTYLTTIIVTLIQMLAIVVMAQLLFDVNALSRPIAVIGSLVFSSVLFTSIGIIIGNLMNNEETAVLLAISLAAGLLFFSSAIVPIENMSRVMAFFAQFSPFTLFEELFRRILILNNPLFSMMGVLSQLLIQLAILCFIVIVSYRKMLYVD